MFYILSSAFVFPIYFSVIENAIISAACAYYVRELFPAIVIYTNFYSDLLNFIIFGAFCELPTRSCNDTTSSDT